MKCAVAECNNCNSKKNQYVGFYRFPKEEIACKQWLIFCRQNIDTATARICGDHFLLEDFERRFQVEMGFGKAMRLKPGVVPTVMTKEVQPANAERCQRILKRENKKIVSSLLQESLVTEEVQQRDEVFPSQEIQKEYMDASSSTTSSEQLFKSKINQLESQVEELKRENFSLRQAAINHEKEIRALQQCAEKAEFEAKLIEDKLLTIFTPGQIKKIKSGNKRRNWCEEDISHSITLYSVSAKVYKLLRKNNFPLPAVRTLQHWALNKDLSLNKEIVNNSMQRKRKFNKTVI